MSPYPTSTSAVSTSAVGDAPSPPKPDYEIEISLNELMKGSYYSFPVMTVGETVRYFSTEGEVTIHLSGESPFRHETVTGTQVPGGVILTLVKSSEGLPNDAFHVGCSVTLSTGEVVGWPQIPSAGGDTHVHKP
jgi:hypothetical protein